MTAGKPPPITPAGFQVLLAIACGHAHGYAVMQFVEDVSGGAAHLGPGTLYRTIARLVVDGLVEEVPERSDASQPHDARRRYYRLTELGTTAAAHEADLMARLVAAATEHGLLDRRRSA